MPFAGHLEEFNQETQCWGRYEKRLKNFLLASKVEEKLLVPTILSIIGDKTYSVVCDLFSPEDPDTKSSQEILSRLADHFSPKVLVPVERYHFSQKKQEKNESIAEFVLALRNLSKNCKYGIGSSLEDRLCEQFVFGLYDAEIRTRLLFEENLPFDVAIKIASGVELAKKGTSTFKFHPNDSEEVNKVKPLQARSKLNGNYKPPQLRSKAPVVNKACKHCGSNSHEEELCRFKDYACNICNKIGHLARICRAAHPRTVKVKQTFKRYSSNGGVKVKNVRVPKFPDDDVKIYEFHRVNINKVIHSSDGPIMLSVLVNKKKVTFELDTGAGVTLIPKSLYLEKFADYKLIPTAVILSTISERIKPLGKIVVSARYNNKEAEGLEIFVIKELSTPLLGRTWISRFEILNQRNCKTVLPIEVNKQSLQLDMLLRKYSKLFSPSLGELKGFEAHLTLRKDFVPRFCKYRPIPFALRSAVELELEKLQAQGILAPIQHSDWAAPIVPILKKDNSIRLCGDYKVGLNPALMTDSYPLPRIEDIFTLLNGGVIFTKLDMTQAYQQLRMDKESQLLLTINTHKGLFKVTRMPFGISPAPSIFQRMMDQVLSGLEGVVCYLDDILVTGKSVNEHLANLDKVLYRLAEAGITLNKFKCEFGKSKVEYLGHMIDATGLHATDAKISGIREAPRPTDVPQLRSFLGLVSYYRKFLPNLSSVLAPLNKLLQKGTKWQWDAAANQAFLKVKEAIISPKVLAYLDLKLPISLACDASPTGLGAVISHIYPDGSDRPIAFASRSLSTAERNYSQLDKEALGIVFGVKKFHQYLFGRRFLLLTDHKPLTRILAKDAQIPTLAAARLQRWSLILSAYDYEIKFRPSASHANADALSRSPSSSIKLINLEEEPNDLLMINHLETLPVTAKMIAKNSAKDAILSQVISFTRNGWTRDCKVKELIPYFSRKDELSLLNGCLLWGLRVVVPLNLQQSILTELHKDHLGIVKMKMLARSYFWWPGLDQAIEKLSKSCPNCFQDANVPVKATIHPWVWPTKPWDRVHLDYAGPFMGHNFLVVVDAHSKWPEVAVMNSTTADKTIGRLECLLSKYGLPEHLVTDNGTQFSSKEFEGFCKSYGIKHTFSAPYHPASNGQAERFVQTLKRTLKKKSKDKSSIDEKLNQLLFSYRSTPHIATHQTPARLFLGRELRIRLDLLRPTVESAVLPYQEKMVSSRDTRSGDRHFTVGESVFARDYFGPHKWTQAVIADIKGPLSYTVTLPNGKCWRRHVDQLRGFLSSSEEEGSDRIGEQGSSPRTVTSPMPTSSSITSMPAVPSSVILDKPKPGVPVRPQTPVPRYPSRNRRPPRRLL